jgi:hypothetical protein
MPLTSTPFEFIYCQRAVSPLSSVNDTEHV